MSKWIGKKLAKRFAPMIKHMYATMGALCKAFYERYGKEALPIISEVMGEAAVEGAKITKGMLRGKGMKAVGELFGMYEMMDIPMEIIELTDDMIHFKGPQCPLGLEGTSKELCEAVMTYDKKMVSSLVGQEVKAEILKSLAAGDEYCEAIFTKK